MATRTPVPPRVNIKVRQPDYDAAAEGIEGFPVAIIDVFTAWRMAWDSTPQKRKMDILRRVQRADSNASLASA